MIRWQSRSEVYRFTNAQQHTSERNTTELSLLGVKVNTVETEHYLNGTPDSIEGGHQTMEIKGAFREARPRNSLTHSQSVTVTRAPHRLPLITLCGLERDLNTTSAISEAIQTGSVNSTTGLLLGFAAWLVFGPVGGAAAWALTGAGAVGTVSAVAQGIEVGRSNNMRDFANQCNEFLVRARVAGLAPNVVEQLRRCAEQADTRVKRDLVRDIIEVCTALFDQEQIAPLRNLLRLMAADDVPPPPYTPPAGQLPAVGVAIAASTPAVATSTAIAPVSVPMQRRPDAELGWPVRSIPGPRTSGYSSDGLNPFGQGHSAFGGSWGGR